MKFNKICTGLGKSLKCLKNSSRSSGSISIAIFSHIPAELTAGLKQSLSHLTNGTIFDNIHHYFE